MIGGWGGEGRGRSLQLDCYTEEILSGRNHIAIGCCSDKRILVLYDGAW